MALDCKAPGGLETEHQARALELQRTLVRWAREGNLRQFPWRGIRDPYRVLLTEMMLRRTRAEQVTPVFLEFFHLYPDLGAFRSASDEDLRRTLQPLGLQWRIDNILRLKTCLRASDLHSPDLSSLTRLPGVGNYVASAVLCFAFARPAPLIDTNLVRLLSRYFGFKAGPETRRRKFFVTLASSLVPTQDFVSYNYATLDLAASVCRHAKPACTVCPLRSGCSYTREEFLRKIQNEVLHSGGERDA